ncbi:MAG TPA: site-specific integrase [Solirubrobacterales bacterium]|nr:site-specific integrase [Solirubrobacterales bacterium]
MAEANPTHPSRSRKSTGGVLPPEGKRRSWTLRFRANGKRHHVTLGTPEEGWNRRRAEAALDDVLAEVRLGVWQPERPAAAPAATEGEPTFYDFARRWIEAREPELGERTRVDYRWRLNHLLAFFDDPTQVPDKRLSAITVEMVDRFRQFKVRERDDLEAARAAEAAKPEDERRRLPRPMSNGSINKTIRLLGAVLEQAVEYGHIDRNPAQGRRRLLKESRPSRSFAHPPQVLALLDAAAAIDAEARQGDTRRRRPLLATLALAGLRIGEALDLRWRDVSLGSQRLRVVESKTDAGVREVALSPTLAEALTEYRASIANPAPDDLVFPTSSGRRDSESNVRTRYLAAAVERANVALEQAGGDPMAALTPHSLRRTFISLLLFAGIDLRRVMAEVGHSDPKTTLGVYAQVVTVDEDFGPVLEALVGRGYKAPGEVASADVRAEASLPALR